MLLKLLTLFALLGLSLLTTGCNRSQHEQPAQSNAVSPIGTGSPTPSDFPGNRLRIASIVGAPEETVLPLIQRINTIAQSNDISISANGEPASHLVLKGYFSNLTENKDIHVLYVWDILDQNGNLIHRLRGEERSTNTLNNREDWSVVTVKMMQNIADRTMKDYNDWISSRR